MTIRTPSSLKWLINQYQTQSRRLRDISRQIEVLTAEHEFLTDNVKSLAKVIDLHEVPLTADDIPQLRSSQKHTKYAHGEITRLIYKYLGSIPEKDSATVSEIVNFCIIQSEYQDLNSESVKVFRKVIRKRLKDMAYLGKITRVEYGTKSREPKYSRNE